MGPPLWFVLALLAALTWAGVDALCKRALREHPPRAVLGARWGYALPFLALPLIGEPLPHVGGTFWLVLLSAGPLEVFAMFLYLRAIGEAPLSLTAPLLAWTPVFSALLSGVVLGEVPSPAGMAGVLCVAAGSWLLYSGTGGDLLSPARALLRERGARKVLAVAFIFSITSAIGKLGLRDAPSDFFGASYVAFLALCLGTLALLQGQGRASLDELRPNRWFVAIGAGTALLTFLHFTALGMTNVAYLVAVKRSSLLASVVLGRLCFGEPDLGRRLPGAAVMLAGVLLLGLGG
jgi:drug/metabolite transporter (DMT)-like permease